MAFILKRHSRLLYNLIRFKQPSASLVARKSRPILMKFPKLSNFNNLTVRTIALSAEKKMEDELNFFEKVEQMVHDLRLSIDNKLVHKEDILKLFETLKQNGEITYDQLTILLKCCTGVSIMCSRAERIQMAKDIWNSAEKFGLKFDLNQYNALLSIFRENNHHFSTKKFLNNMRNNGVEPNALTYKILLRASSQQSNLQEMKYILDEMKNLNYPLNKQDFDSFILCYCNVGDFEKANEVFDIMKDKEMEPSGWAYVHLLCGYIKYGDLDKFKELFNEYSNTKNFLHLHYLEIIYTLAVNKQHDLIDMVLEKFSEKKFFEKLLAAFSHRLLHERQDSVVLKLLEMVDITNRQFNFGPLISRHVLDHFVNYRKVNEILDICRKLEEIGYARAPAAYCLKKIFFTKNENFALNFIQEMNAQDLPVRIHYYWPIIIKASKEGNQKLISVLKKMPLRVIKNNGTALNVILPKYDFSDDWEADFEKLTKVGVKASCLAKFLIIRFLLNNNIDEVEKITANYPVYSYKMKIIFDNLFAMLKKNPDKVNQVVNILYHLSHDAYLKNEMRIEENDPLEDPEESTSDFPTYGDAVVARLLSFTKNESLILSVLEGLLEKKICITSKAGSLITESFPDQNFADLVSKLSDPSLRFEPDEKLLSNKTPDKSNKFQTRSFMVSKKALINNMITLASNNDIKKAIEIGEDFARQRKEKITVKEKKLLKKLYNNFLSIVFNNKGVTLAEKCLDLGVKLDVLSSDRDYYALFILYLLKHDELSKAIEKFKEFLIEHGSVLACVEILTKCISEGKTEAVQEVTELVSGVVNRNVALSHLIIALAVRGEVEKAKEVLSTPGLLLEKDLFLNKFATYDVTVLENLVQVLKDVNDFDDVVVSLYKLLVRRYAAEKKVDKIQNICPEIMKRNIEDYEFLLQLSKFQEYLDVTSLYESLKASAALERKGGKSTKIDFLNRIFEGENMKKDELPTGTSVPLTEASSMAQKLASQGVVEKVYSLVEKYSLEKEIKKIGSAFLKSNKMDEFFEFLELLESKGDFTSVSECLRVSSLAPALAKNDEHFKKYKSLLLQCANQTYNSAAIASYFVTCVELPGKLQDAEDIVNEYPNHFKNLPFSQIKEAVEATDFVSNFYENILFSQKLKDLFSDHLPTFYSKVISSKCKENNLNHALSYLELAASDKVENLLDKNVIKELEKKCKKAGKNFPRLESNPV